MTDGAVTTAAGQDTRERILIEASQLFAAKGYYGTTTREIAAEVGIQQPSLFHHFATKQDIMSALYQLDLGRALEIVHRESTGNDVPEVRLYRYLAEDVTALLSSPYNLAGLNRTDVIYQPEFAEYAAMLEELRRIRLAMVRDCIESGACIQISPVLAHEAITSMIVGTILMNTSAPGENAEQHAADLAGLALRSLLSDPDRLAAIRSEAGYPV